MWWWLSFLVVVAVLAVLVWLLVGSPPGARNLRSLGKNQAVSVGGGIWREPTAVTQLMESMDGLHSALDFFRVGLKRAGRNGDCLGVRATPTGPYQFASYGDVELRLRSVAAGLRFLGGVGAGDRVGIWLRNCPEWTCCELACYAQSFVSVPVFDSLSAEQAAYIINLAECAVLLVGIKQFELLVAADTVQLPSVRLVVVVGGAEGQVPASVPRGGAAVVRMEALERAGRERPCDDVLPSSPQALATIVFTSGTTGNPKGVMLTHANLRASGAASDARFSAFSAASQTHFSYLPLSHIFERQLQLNTLYVGGKIGFFGGDVARLFDDVVALRPTFFCGVPRVYNRVYDRILASVAAKGAVVRALFYGALWWKRRVVLPFFGSLFSPLVDAVVFRAVRRQLGMGQVRFLLSAAAPLSQDVMETLSVVLATCFCQGYGCTESTAGVTISVPFDRSALQCHVGPPLACCEVRVVPIPGLARGAGEVLVRGPNVFQGYWRDEAATRAAIDGDGWLHTGDVGEIAADGTLLIVDRLKAIVKTARGEYVSPEKIENILGLSPLVANIFVAGDPKEEELVAVVVPRGGATKQQLEAELARISSEKNLLRHERVAAISLCVEEFTIANGMLTPTGKLKRPVAQKRFAAEIAAMFAGLK